MKKMAVVVVLAFVSLMDISVQVEYNIITSVA